MAQHNEVGSNEASDAKVPVNDLFDSRQQPSDAAPSVLAVAAHPDDIEFVMSGTLLRLAAAGWRLHYFNIANGCCGSKTLNRQQCAKTRLEEAQAAASMLGATFYTPICNDLEVFYNLELLQQVAAVVRQARPQIVLTHAPVDYMEDHQNASRLAVSAAFTRGMPNVATVPEVLPFDEEIAVYHAQPHGNRTPLGEIVRPTHFVDVEELLPRKRELLSAHASQAQWLDATQQMNSYLAEMEAMNREVGGMSHVFSAAEGWRQHIHLGLSTAGFDPLRSAITEHIQVEI